MPVEGIAMEEGKGGTDLSVVIPVFNEEESLPVLVPRILGVVAENHLGLEQIILVDDGSTDGSWEIMRRLASEHAEITAVRLRRNFGKATALNIGINAATASIIITMDADLQDDPSELPRFIEAIEDGHDLVSGWKKMRYDPLSKTLPSRLFNWATAVLSGIPLHDFNSGFKAYRRQIFDSVELYGELHRFVPVLANSLGFRIGELVVRHHPRRFGKSKFGVRRFLHGFVDLLTVLAITRYARRPGHLFGGAGTVLLVAGLAVITYLSAIWIGGAHIGGRPLLLFGVLAVILGLQVLFFGILAELINSRTPGAQPKTLVRETASGKGTIACAGGSSPPP